MVATGAPARMTAGAQHGGATPQTPVAITWDSAACLCPEVRAGASSAQCDAAEMLCARPLPPLAPLRGRTPALGAEPLCAGRLRGAWAAGARVGVVASRRNPCGGMSAPSWDGRRRERPAAQLDSVRTESPSWTTSATGYKLDRISRSLRDFYEVWEVIRQAGATFVSATESFDTSAPAGMLMLNILLSFAQFEREVAVERTAAKMRARAQRGLWNGGLIPFGYDYDRQVQLLTPHPDEAQTVRRIFLDLISLGSLARVCDSLTADGILTRTRTIVTRNGEPRQVGGRRFRPDGIRNLIQNPLYMGLIRCQGEDYPGKHEALISDEDWHRANAVLAARSSRVNPSSPRDEHCHLLKGLIRCEDCGSTMSPHPSGKSGKDGERFLYYACTAVVREPQRCKCRVRRLPVRRFENAVIRLLGEIGEDEGASSPWRNRPAIMSGMPCLDFIESGMSADPDSNYWRNSQHGCCRSSRRGSGCPGRSWRSSSGWRRRWRRCGGR